MEARGARGGGAAVSLSAPAGPRREGGERVSMAPGLRGPRGRGARSGSSSSRRSRDAQLGGRCASGARPATPPSLPVACAAWCHRAAAAPSSGRRTSPAPRAPHTNFCPASPTCARASDLRSRGSARRAVRVAAKAAPPRGEDLAPVALGPPRLGGRRLAARQRPAAPAGHGSGARALWDSGESGPCAPPPPRGPGARRSRSLSLREGTGSASCRPGSCELSQAERGGNAVTRNWDQGLCAFHPTDTFSEPDRMAARFGCVRGECECVSVNFWKSN